LNRNEKEEAVASFNEYKSRIKQEVKAERKAAIEVGSTSFEDILRFNKLPVEFDSKNKKGEIIKVRGQDIKKDDLWQKFLSSKGHIDADLISLVDNVDLLTETYDTFLDTKHTDRYHNLDGEGKKWRRKVVRLAVTYHIMENKLDGYLQGQDTFADDRVAYYYTLVRQIRTAMAGAARAIQHIVKDKEERQQYLNDFFSAHYEQFRTIPFPQRDDILRLVEPDNDEDDDNGTMVRAAL
jgi:hypothetical protein